MGIQVCENQGAGSFWGPVRDQNRGNFGYLKKCLNALIFGLEHPCDKEIQVCTIKVPVLDFKLVRNIFGIQICTNEVPGVINGPHPRGR